MAKYIWIFLLLFASVPACQRNVDPPPTREKEIRGAMVPSTTNPDSEPSAPDSPKISILAWNVESGGSDPAVIATQLSQLAGHDVYCLSEVDPSSFTRYATAVGQNFISIEGTTGRDDRLQILVDTESFELLEQKELTEYRGYTLNNGTHRSPLYVRLKHKPSQQEMVVMTNHLARGNAELRKEQAIGLREWARDQAAALVNIGDFNMDYDFASGLGNDAFPEMLRDNIWSWVRPAELIDTNWADSDGDGMDNYPDSMLDFAFVAGSAKTWSPTSRVIVRDGDFPDNDVTSDHRPIELTLLP